jgi:glutamate/tyrosine decarboxylase-like PLP-dependent enzyme
MYKFLRLGKEGYTSKVQNQMTTAAYIRNFLRDLKHPSGKPRFQMLDGGEKAEQCLPVVAARLNPDLELHYDDIDFQHALSETYVTIHYSKSFVNSVVRISFSPTHHTIVLFLRFLFWFISQSLVCEWVLSQL